MQTRQYKFIYSNKTGWRILRHACFWVCWYIYEVVLFLYNNSNVQSNFWLNLQIRCLKLLKVFPIGIIHCYIVVYWLVPQFLFRKKYLPFITWFLIAFASEIYFVDIVTYNRFDFLSIWVGIASYVSRAGPLLYLIFFIIKTLKAWYIKQWERDALIKENLDAELQLLRAQVHPHFLFNTLNNIYAFILSNPPQARELVQKLEKLLRYMINECDRPLVPLHREINMLNDYLELEKVRYGNRLNLQMNIQNSSENKMIVPLLMIPFVENSFKHGTSKMLRDPWIKLDIEVRNETLHFSLSNSKPKDVIRINSKPGIGINNVKKRLALLYPNEHFIFIKSAEDSFTAEMRLPLKNIKEESLAQ